MNKFDQFESSLNQFGQKGVTNTGNQDKDHLKILKGFFANDFAKDYEKEMILGTSDAWSMRWSSHQLSVLY